MNLQNLKGVGDKTLLSFYEANIYTLDDLLTYYPYRYQILIPTVLDNKISDDTVIINAIVSDISRVAYIKKNLNVLRMKVITNGKLISLVIYNRAYLRPNLKIGQKIIATGKYDVHKNLFTASNLKFGELLEKQIIPVYHSIKNIKNAVLEKIIKEGLKEALDLEDYIPQKYLEKYHFINKDEAMRVVHQPNNEELLNIARNRLIYEELFLFLFKVQYLKKIKVNEETIIKKIDKNLINDFINNLPFKLTNDQLKSINEGLDDFTSKKRMNRLLLGDVGSGKTIVATVLLYANFLAGYQGAFMAPTELLATQHYDSIKKLLEKLGLKVELLIGSMTKKNKNDIMKKVSNNEVDILIGTHAILNENLSFANLGFVITDEQHRFGVNQRNILQEKGVKPDVLFMSATPIPRTYALTIYGDMDTSIIKEKPNGRKDIITCVKKESELKDVLYKVLEEIKLNHQIYVVAPMILENEDMPLKTVLSLKEKFDSAFHGKVPTEVLHGKLKAKEKDEIMNNFKTGQTKILISTTVIEVGVDVPLATMMIIFNAERFGLATLHQLRGRVGRNDMQSYCYLICNEDVKRLKVLEESNDGFYISEKDFEFRGEGDLFGERQSGDMTFKIADLRKNYDVLLKALDDVKEWIDSEEYLKVTSYVKIIEELKFNN